MNWALVLVLIMGMAAFFVWTGLVVWVGSKITSLWWGYVAVLSMVFVPIILVIGMVAR